jgi:hypothetical protein
MGTVLFTHDVGQTGAEGYFDPFYGIHDQQTQFAVHDVDIENVVESDAVFEGMMVCLGCFPLKGETVTGKSVISDVAEVVAGLVPIGDLQPSGIRRSIWLSRLRAGLQ